ncbi:hypothetical protein [Metabacillus arenae]|uniref:Uncharacterized protein n=1 Tax=Metabacillus arenae TaxID=2771434 RepID=A0A926NGJ4_9BACI|nr:hypothetical protein [Metabacillus arenae]MBD1380113.1 hypothetical protein [Metabacillus arenae]
MKKEKQVNRNTYYFDHEGEKETFQQISNAYESGVVDEQNERYIPEEYNR